MKRFFLFSIFVLFTVRGFAISDISLFHNAKPYMTIESNKMYDTKDDETFLINEGKLFSAKDHAFVGTIKETTTLIMIDLYYDEKTVGQHSEYNKSNGYLLTMSIYNDNQEIKLDFDYDTGLIQKQTNVEDKKIVKYSLFQYNGSVLEKVTEYNSKNELITYLTCFYDKKTKNILEKHIYDSDDNLLSIAKFNPSIDKLVEEQIYNKDGSLKSKTTFDKDEKPVEKFVYRLSSKKPVKYTFIKFDENGFYNINDKIHLSTRFCDYESLKQYALDSKVTPVDWNDKYSADVKKCDFNDSLACYNQITKLQNDHILLTEPFCIINDDSMTKYCFNITEDNEIDVFSCYEITLKEKPKNYPAMNKSGKGSGPFGFDIGMTYDQVKAACGGKEPEHIADDRYYVKPKKTHPVFEKYIVWISDSVGLYYIKAISGEISTSKYGTEIKSRFQSVLKPLESKYGEFYLENRVKQEFYFKDDENWMYSLMQGARTYNASWFVNADNYQNYDGLFGIMMGISAQYSSSGYIWIEYDFLNSEDARKDHDDAL